jgi:hypothetical protein
MKTQILFIMKKSLFIFTMIAFMVIGYQNAIASDCPDGQRVKMITQVSQSNASFGYDVMLFSYLTPVEIEVDFASTTIYPTPIETYTDATSHRISTLQKVRCCSRMIIHYST